jgi:hypothetical protein
VERGRDERRISAESRAVLEFRFALKGVKL